MNSPKAPSPTDQQTASFEKRTQALFMLIFALLTAAVAAAGVLSYQSFSRQFRTQVNAQLLAIANLKVSGLVEWRSERLADAQTLTDNAAFAALFARLSANPADAEAQAQLQDWLDALRLAYQYDRIYLLDRDGNVFLDSPPGSVPSFPHPGETLQHALETGEVAFLDFHPHGDAGIHIGILAPIDAAPEASPALGAVVLEIDPAVYLYPYIQQWPAPSQTAETLLVRREGEEIVYLTPLRFEPDAALHLRIPLDQTDVLAVQAALGRTGAAEGIDYRGQKVVGAIMPVPDSPWYLAARMDADEVYAPLRARLWQTAIFFGIMIVAAGAGLSFLWRQRRIRFYRQHYEDAQALRESEERYRSIFEQAGDGIVVYDLEQKRALDANPAYLRLLGYSLEEIRALSLYDIVAHERASVEGYEKRIRAEKQVRIGERQHRRKDGSLVDVDVNVSVISYGGRSAMMAVVHDISEQKRAKDALQKRYQELTAVYQSARQLQRLISLEELSQTCINLLESVLGYEYAAVLLLDEASGELIPFALSGRLDDPQFLEKDKAYVRSRRPRLGLGITGWVTEQGQSLRVGDVTQDPRYYGIRDGIRSELCVPLFAQEKVIGVINVETTRPEAYSAEDQRTLETIAAQLSIAIQNARLYAELEQRVAERTQQLREAQEQLVRQERLAALGQVAGSIGHELRNPLGVIANAVYFLRAVQPDANQTVREYLDIIEKQTRSADKTVSDLLDFTRIKSLDRQPVSVSEIVQQTLAYSPVPLQVTVTVSVPADLPPACADPRHVVQILGNLVNNACEAMPEGGHLFISAEVQKDDMIGIKVQDTGIGIPPENLNKIFEPLFTTKTKGIGLGLAVSQKLAEANGGRIEVQSEPGEGSVFTLFLPVYKET